MRRRTIGAIAFAAALILFGGLLLAFTFFGLRIRWVAGWWTFLLMGLALFSMAVRGPRFWNGMLLGSAILLFARWQNFLLHSWWQLGVSIGALALILLGISLIWHTFRPGRAPQPPVQAFPYTRREHTGEPAPPPRWNGAPPQDAPRTGEANPSRFALFSSETCRSDCKALQSGRFTAIFGAVLVDLTQADFARPLTLDVYNVFGGVDILTPPGVRVECAGTSVFGGCDARSISGRPYDPSHPVLTIRHVSVFGGVNVK